MPSQRGFAHVDAARPRGRSRGRLGRGIDTRGRWIIDLRVVEAVGGDALVHHARTASVGVAAIPDVGVTRSRDVATRVGRIVVEVVEVVAVVEVVEVVEVVGSVEVGPGVEVGGGIIGGLEVGVAIIEARSRICRRRSVRFRVSESDRAGQEGQ